MISDATLKEVSHIFCEDVEGYFSYKSGPKLVNFSMNTIVGKFYCALIRVKP